MNSSSDFRPPAVFVFILILFSGITYAQVPLQNYTVQVSAAAQSSPARLDFSWPIDNSATGYTIYRKQKTASTWGSSIAMLPGTATTWSDSNLVSGDNFEYRFQKSGSGYNGYGFIYAGVEAPVTEERGILLLVVDTTYLGGLASEVATLRSDLEGDGWKVQQISVDRNDAVASVKGLIVAAYTADPTNVKMVYLLGHVPVPYSGNLYPDGHPDHQGAWPADAFYGEMNGTWTDGTVNNIVATRPENDNIPGDGKYDQSNIPTDVELQVGRVDFANMPAFPQTEQQLLKRYLDKAHAWKHRQFTVSARSVVDDNFGVFTGPPLENFATSGYRNFAPMLGAANIVTGDYRTQMSGSLSCLWSYGCGGGSYTSASGVTTTTDFVNDSLNGVFSMIFGSYHGDWDVSNNLMRAALASKGTILSCSWAGRPQWHYHHMGLGEAMGYSAKVTQNNTGSMYISGYGARGVHIGLLGDPSLRLNIVAPPSSLVINLVNNGRDAQISWTASADTVIGYFVYRAENGSDYVRITPTPLTATSFTDPCLAPADYSYMVRAYKLEDGFSGSYYNLSQGIFGDVTVSGTYSLATNTLPASFFCTEDVFNLDFTATGPYCPGNIFSAELSDATGNFASPVVIGTVADTNSGTISCQIPLLTVPGTGYRIRVTGDLPEVTGSDNGTDVEIQSQPVAGFSYTQSGNDFSFTNSSSGAGTYAWDFGDGNIDTGTNPVHTFSSNGNYTVTLIVTNSCGSDTTTQEIIYVGNGAAQVISGISLWPNPAGEHVFISGLNASVEKISLIDLLGQTLMEKVVREITQQGDYLLDVSECPSGIYFLVVEGIASRIQFKLVVE